MNIYLVRRTDNWDYDQYDSFVCVAESEEQAKLLNPQYDPYFETEMFYDFNRNYCDWASSPDLLEVTKIGVSDSDEVKIILRSYNAG